LCNASYVADQGTSNSQCEFIDISDPDLRRIVRSGKGNFSLFENGSKTGFWNTVLQ
jgi:hypothetical protein